MIFMKTEIETFERIEPLMEYISEQYKNWPGYIFRGQANEDWLLESSLSRDLKNIEDIEERDNIKERHYIYYRNNIRGKRGKNPVKLDDNELITLGQHFGLKTTLLDWTWSPYIALFFSFAEPSQNISEYRSLWCLNCDDIFRINNNYKNETERITVMEPEVDINQRIINQAGILLDVPLGINIEDWLKDIPEYKWNTIDKIRINAKLRYDILMILEQMNINYNTLFPDLIGASLDCNLRLSLLSEKERRQNELWE
jgi:hypothetical protein